MMYPTVVRSTSLLSQGDVVVYMLPDGSMDHRTLRVEAVTQGRMHYRAALVPAYWVTATVIDGEKSVTSVKMIATGRTPWCVSLSGSTDQ